MAWVGIGFITEQILQGKLEIFLCFQTIRYSEGCLCEIFSFKCLNRGTLQTLQNFTWCSVNTHYMNIYFGPQ